MFTYLKFIAKGGFGTVYLTKIPGIRRRLIKKEFIRRSAICAEIYFYNILSDNIKKQYFPLFYRAYERRVNYITFPDTCFNNEVIYGIDMQYLHPNSWQNLGKLFHKDDKRINTIFRKLIRFQIALFKEGAMYYDMSPSNVFVHRTSNEIRMVDYGGLFIPDNPQELYEGNFGTYRQKFPNPFDENMTITTITHYKNEYFEGPLKIPPDDVSPALYAIIVTIHLCLDAMIHPKQDLSYFNIKTLLNNPDIVDEWTLLDGGGGESYA